MDGAVPQLDEGLVEAIGAVRILQKEMCELKGSVVERTERERQSNLGKLWDELAEEHITQEQLKKAHAGDLERDRFEAAQMRDNASSEYHVVSQVGSAADVEHAFFLLVKEVREMLSTVQARPLGIAVYSATTAATDVDTTVAKTEARSPGIAKQSAMVKLGLLRLPSTAPQQSQCLLAMVLPGLQCLRSTVPQQSLQQWKSLLAKVKLGLLGLQSAWSQQNPYSQSLLVSFMRKL